MRLPTDRPLSRGASALCAALFIGSIAWLAAPTSAQACEPPDCERFGYFGVDDGADVPPNIHGIPWAPDSYIGDIAAPDEEHIRLIQDPDGEAQELDATVEHLDGAPWLVVPDEPLAGDTSYELQAACPRYDADNAPLETLRWQTTADDAPIPEEIGTLQIEAQELIEATIAASPDCSVEAPIYAVDLKVDLADGAIPWEGALQFETQVTDDAGDTQIWNPSIGLGREHAPGASWMGRTVERLYTHCGDYSGAEAGLQPGTYDVTLTATLPGEDLALETDTLEVTLECPEDVDNGDDDNGDDDNGDDDNGAHDNGDDHDDSGSCAAASGTSPGLLMVLMALLAMGMLRRSSATPVSA